MVDDKDAKKEQGDQENIDSSKDINNGREKSEEFDFDGELESFFKIDLGNTIVNKPEETETTPTMVLSYGWEFLKQTYMKIPSRETLASYLPSISSITFPGLQPTTQKVENENIEDLFVLIEEQKPIGKHIKSPNMANNDLPTQASTKTNNNNKRTEAEKDKKTRTLDPHFQINYNELTLISEIDRGTHGIVYHVKWRNTAVALKQILDTRAPKKVHDLFLKEIKINAQLRHPNIVQFIGIVDEPTRGLGIVLEYMPGGTLSALLKDNKTEIHWSLRCQLSLGIANALAFLHPDILHCDIKSTNIFVTLDWNTKLGDLGFAFTVSGEKTGSHQQIAGSPAYMAPELLTCSGQCSPETDIFSAGTVFNEIATRETPHPEVRTLSQLIKKLTTTDRKDEIPLETPNIYQDLILHCWKTVASERPKANEVVEVLEKFKQEFKS